MTDIRLVDDRSDKIWQNCFNDLCGLNDLDDYDRKILEPHLNEIIDEILSQEYPTTLDATLVGFQILGLLIIQTGAQLPDIVRYSILFSTTWEYDKRRGWAKLVENERKNNLEKFRNAIINHKTGLKIEIDF